MLIPKPLQGVQLFYITGIIFINDHTRNLVRQDKLELISPKTG